MAFRRTRRELVTAGARLPNSPEEGVEPVTGAARRVRVAALANWTPLVLLMAALASHAAPDDKLVDDWIRAQAAVRAWEADFTQTRQLKALTEPLVATGKLWFAAPDRFRWEIIKPAPTLAVREQDQLLLIFPKLKRAERYSLARIREGPWKDLMGLLDTGFPRSRAEFERQFHVRNVVPISGGQRLVIEPVSPLVKKYMPEVDIDIRTPDLTLLATSMIFVDGSVLKNEFSNPRKNPPIDESLFQPALGPDYKITEPLSETTK
jgi:outer membrane lipoprotein-sorting protein